MKINFFNDESMLIYINNNQVPDLDIESKEVLEKYFKKIFLKLHHNYNINLYGYYNIILYHDDNYGIVINLHKEDLDYYDYFDKEIDMRIIINKNNFFLYQIDDYFSFSKEELTNTNIYSYKGKLYLRLTKKVDFMTIGKILEKSELVYKDTDIITKHGRKLKTVGF